MRDLVLANQYAKKGHNIIFATQNLNGNINKNILENGFKIITLKSDDKKELSKTIKKQNIHMVVFDSYNIDYDYEKYIKQTNNVKILSFDDTYENHYCDILLNHNISGDKNKYKGKVPKFCKLKCGSKYTLLRDEFIKEKLKKTQRKKSLISIFIAMGGADTAHLNIKILKVLQKISNININIVTTTANKNLEKLKLYIKNINNITLYINTSDIAMLLAKTSFAIITPSVIANEVSYMKVPFIAIKTATNQKEMYKYLKKKNINVLKKFNHKLLLMQIYKLLKD